MKTRFTAVSFTIVITHPNSNSCASIVYFNKDTPKDVAKYLQVKEALSGMLFSFSEKNVSNYLSRILPPSQPIIDSCRSTDGMHQTDI